MLPAGIGSLLQLTELRIVGSYGITDGIPAAWSNLTRLEALELSGLGGMHGSLPAAWAAGGLTALSELVLTGMPGVTLPPGPLPHVLAPSNRLTRAVLSDLDAGTGRTLDPQLPTRYPNLTELVLPRLALVGSLPVSWSALGDGRLRVLDLNSNALSGSLPSWTLAGLAPGASLNLANNMLGGAAAPPAFLELLQRTRAQQQTRMPGSLSSSRDALLSQDRIPRCCDGRCRRPPGTLPQLTVPTGNSSTSGWPNSVRLSLNKIRGSIPASYLPLILNAHDFSLDNNRLDGSLPSAWYTTPSITPRLQYFAIECAGRSPWLWRAPCI